jgi:predicted nucleic acid-binding protein
MKLVLDASVAVAAARPMERTHAAAKLVVADVLGGAHEIVVPAIFQVEVASALMRNKVSEVDVTIYVDQLLARARVVTIGPRTAAKIQRVAMQTHLRAADAAYAWLAGREKVPLITSDDEVLQRAPAVCTVQRP